MFAKALGYLSIFLGVLWIVFPWILRGWLVMKASRTIFWALFLPVFYPILSYSGRWGVNGWLAAIVAFFVIGGLIRGALGKAAQKIPLFYYRLAGAANAASGLYLVYFKNLLLSSPK